MNRIFNHERSSTTATPQSANAARRPDQRLRDEAESILREMAFVLAMTRRVKAEIVHQRDLIEAASA